MSGEAPKTQVLDSGKMSLRHQGELLNGRYYLERQVGHGAMGVVWQATDVKLERQVAIKMLPEESLFPDARERLLREARAAAALNHSHIVAVYDVGEDLRGVPFFVMELVSGRSLGEGRPTTVSEIVGVAIQICLALEHAHAHGLVHRDLKPENVLLAAEFDTTVVKLADLGLAVPSRGSRLTQAGTIVGTVSYMAPEQAMGEAVDGRADLYSLGVVLYELTTGRLPFTGDRPLTVISQHVNAPVVPPRTYRPDLPRSLEAIILKLLAKRPSERFPTATETADALRHCLGAQSAAVEEPQAAVALLDALSRGRLVGRATELGEAREIWSRARQGQGHGVLVSGEPGAGKTRLCRELMIQAAFEGATVLTGSAYEHEATTPYLPFAEAFRRLVRDHRDMEALRRALGDGAPLLARLAPELETRLGPFAPRPELPPHEARLLFLDAVVQAFRGLSGPKGLLFYVDDIHWADASTLWLFGHLLRNVRGERILLLASYREAELDRSHPLSKALVDWNRERLTTRIALKRFGSDETRQQLAALLGEDVTEDFAAAVHRETEGNPFFVEEVLKALIEEGAVRREAGGWRRRSVGELRIPQSVKAAIGNRLDRVSAECNDVLKTAAVLGKTFDFEELAAASRDADEDALLDALDLAVDAQLLAASRDGGFAFTHDKIREVLYEELNPIRRRRLHLKVAEGLEERRKRAPVAVATLAHHFVEAGDHARGLSYAREAGAEAERLLAYDEAIAAYARAEQCAEALGLPDERAALDEAMGKVAVLSGDLLPAQEHFERALSRTTDPTARARLQSQAATSLVVVGDPRGLAYLDQALAILDPESHPVETAYAKVTQARFHHLGGRHRKAIEVLEEAARLAAPTDPGAPLVGLQATTLTQAFAFLAGAHQQVGLFADGDRWARRAIELGSTHGIPLAEAFGYEFLGENSITAGNWTEGLGHAEKEREIAARLHSRERRAWTYLVTSACHWCLGHFEEALAEVKEGLALSEAIGERRLASLLSGTHAVVLADLGRGDEALELGQDVAAKADELGLEYMRTDARRCLALVHQRRGEREEACTRCEEVVRMDEGREPVISRLWVGPIQVESLRGLGRDAEAREVLARWAPLVRASQSPYFDRVLAGLEQSRA